MPPLYHISSLYTTIIWATARQGPTPRISPAVRSFLKEMGYKFKEVIDMDPQKQRIKKHIANGYPVLITGTGSRASLGHMVVLVGFDDSRQVFYVCDPAGHGIDKVCYDELHYFHEPDCYSLVIFPKK